MRLLAIWWVLAISTVACGSGGPGGPGDDDDAPPADAYEGPTVTRTYQQGAGGYAGTRSVGISTYGGLGNIGQYNANGMTFADGLNDWCTGIDIPSGTYSEVWLLRFEDLGVPAGTRVVSATLGIHGYGDGSPGQFFAGGYLARPWFGETPESCAGCSNSPVGWRWANGDANAWAAFGAAGAGDTIAGKTFRLPSTGDVGTGSAPAELTTALDPAVVQGWVDGGSHGLRIVAGVNGHHMGYVQAQRNAGRPTEMRPKLTIVYAN